MLYILDSMEEIKLRLLTDDYGKHLMGVEDLLQKHALVEADINVLGERVKVCIFKFKGPLVKQPAFTKYRTPEVWLHLNCSLWNKSY